jgi:hypothetical protein
MKLMTKATLSVLALAMLSAPSASQAGFNAEQSKTVFDKFASLQGVWEGSYKDAKTPHRVTYRLTANGSVLLEEWQMSPTRTSMTVYILDNGQLIATHYCPQQTQPRLALQSEDQVLGYSFKRVGGGNLNVRGRSHQEEFTLRVVDATTMVRSEQYVENGKRLSPGSVGEAVTYRRIMP